MSSKADFNAGNSSSISSISKSMQLEVYKDESNFDKKEPNEVKHMKQGGRGFFSGGRLKSMLRAGMVSNVLNTKKGKIKIVHDSHHHKHDKYMIHPLSRFK